MAVVGVVRPVKAATQAFWLVSALARSRSGRYSIRRCTVLIQADRAAQPFDAAEFKGLDILICRLANASCRVLIVCIFLPLTPSRQSDTL